MYKAKNKPKKMTNKENPTFQANVNQLASSLLPYPINGTEKKKYKLDTKRKVDRKQTNKKNNSKDQNKSADLESLIMATGASVQPQFKNQIQASSMHSVKDDINVKFPNISETNRKFTSKTLVNNPYDLKWPALTLELQDQVLEQLLSFIQQGNMKSGENGKNSNFKLKVVGLPIFIFVCKEDISPISLLIPLLQLASMTSSSLSPTYILPLGKGAELKMGQALGIKHASVFSIHGGSLIFKAFLDYLKENVIPNIESLDQLNPWLSSTANSILKGRLLKDLNTKTLKTKAPIRAPKV